MKTSDHGVLPHHQRAAAMWGRGGKAYDEVSFAISDALAHAAQRLNACAGSVSSTSPQERAGPPAM